MKRRALTAHLLLVAMLFAFGGTAQWLHAGTHAAAGHADHPGHAPHDHDDHAPQPQGNADCPTCFVIAHAAGSTLDLASLATLPASAQPATVSPSDAVFVADSTHLPEGRGPPAC